MNILYTCDNNYVWLMGISMISLFENNKDIKDLHVYLLGENISLENKQILKEIANNYNKHIDIIDVPKFDIAKSLISARWPLSAFTRLYSAQLLPNNIKKILYLDCDTIVSGDISKLDNIDLTGKIAFGVKDCVSGEYKKNIGINPNDAYINAGVLLLNLEELKKIDINIKIESVLQKYEKYINYADQDILNALFNGQIGYLDPKYNLMSIVAKYSYEEILKLRHPSNYYEKDIIENAVKKPTIIHYTTNMRIIRPWFSNSNHPFKDEFLRYKAISYWKDKDLKEFKFKNKSYQIIGILEKLPKSISYSLLGFIHSDLKPKVIRMKAEINK